MSISVVISPAFPENSDQVYQFNFYTLYVEENFYFFSDLGLCFKGTSKNSYFVTILRC